MTVQISTKDSNVLHDHGLASEWRAEHVAAIAGAARPEAALITAAQAQPLLADSVLWDIWPIQTDDGALAEVAGGSLWIMLSAPRGADPDDRHNIARMRLIFLHGAQWHDCGALLPDGFSPGSREWSGSTRLDPHSGRITLWFTASGRRGELQTDFEQRLFQATGQLNVAGPLPHIDGWHDLRESIVNDGTYYADLRVTQGIAGRIKGFRDPYWFRDPANGKGYLLFTGSKPLSSSRSDYDGVIGIAAAQDAHGQEPFALLPPLIDADGLANELERPHMFVRDGLYYLFWSSQASVFAPTAPKGPTGLYGMVGPTAFGPFEPLNGTGLVIANPAEEPRQAYAWQVLPSLEVVSFVDYWGLNGRDVAADLAFKAAQFGGTIAPVLHIEIDGPATRILKASA
jgi:levansucrase